MPDEDDDDLEEEPNGLRNNKLWFEQLGYELRVFEKEAGVFVVALTHTRNAYVQFSRYARGVTEELAVAHARERLEEELVSRPQLSPGLWPLTVFPTRYGGTYEGGAWAALPCYPYAVPLAAMGSDTECLDWWSQPPLAVGLGATPERAVAALREAVSQCEHPGDRRRSVPVGFVCEYCSRLVKYA